MLNTVKAEEVGAGDVVMVNGDGYEITAVESFVRQPQSGYETDGRLEPVGKMVRVHFMKYAPSLKKEVETYREFLYGSNVSVSVAE